MELPTDSPKLKNWIVHPRRNLSRWLMQQRVTNREFTIISNDCWGAQVYQELDLPYRTPFMGTFLMAPCYLKLLQDLPGYLRSPLHFTPQSRYEFTDCDYLLKRNERHAYPIGLLKDDVEVHFVHYANEQEAREKWNRRLQRTLWDQGQLLIKFSNDRILCREEALSNSMPCPFPTRSALPIGPTPSCPQLFGSKTIPRTESQCTSGARNILTCRGGSIEGGLLPHLQWLIKPSIAFSTGGTEQ